MTGSAVGRALMEERTLEGTRLRRIIREATPKGLDLRALRAEATALAPAQGKVRGRG